MSNCPQNEFQFRDYFFTLISRGMDTPADDWAAVMSKEYLWSGDMMRIPPGVGPGVILPPDAPFYGLTQQWSNGPKARIFLPTAAPDSNGYYTRNIQYIRDAGLPNVQFLWDWRYIDGNEYVPICEGDVPVPTPPNGDYVQRIETLEAQVANLENRVSQLEQTSNPSVIALIADNGKYVTAEVTSNPAILVARGDNPDAWQRFRFIVIE